MTLVARQRARQRRPFLSAAHAPARARRCRARMPSARLSALPRELHRADGVARAHPYPCLILALGLAMTAQSASGICIVNATIADLQQALADGRVSSTDLVRAYLQRIEAYDRAGPRLNAVREVNPEALAIAADLDAKRPAWPRPLAGIPILVKDNIATARPAAHHRRVAGLAEARARTRRDASSRCCARPARSSSARPI